MGGQLYIPVGAIHSLANKGDEILQIIEFQCGDYLGEDDIVRFSDVYGRASDESDPKRLVDKGCQVKRLIIDLDGTLTKNDDGTYADKLPNEPVVNMYVDIKSLDLKS